MTVSIDQLMLLRLGLCGISAGTTTTMQTVAGCVLPGCVVLLMHVLLLLLLLLMMLQLLMLLMVMLLLLLLHVEVVLLLQIGVLVLSWQRVVHSRSGVTVAMNGLQLGERTVNV